MKHMAFEDIDLKNIYMKILIQTIQIQNTNEIITKSIKNP